MKLVKMLGLVALAAMATMAVVASSASASATICTNDVAHQDIAICEGTHGKHLKIGSAINAALAPGTHATLTVTNGSGGTVRIVTCKKSTATGALTSTTGGINITGLTFTECESAGCSNVTAVAPRTGKTFPWAGTVTKTSGTDGLLHVTGPSGKFTATCLGITATCEYETSSATVTAKGGAPGQLIATAVPLELKAGVAFICGAKADWTATYNISTPTSVFVT